MGDPFWQENHGNLKLNRLDYRGALLQRPENKPTTLYQCILYLAPGDYHRSVILLFIYTLFLLLSLLL